MPSYNNPLLTAHALTKRRPSGWNACHRCGKSHEQGNCPAYMGRPVTNARVLIISKPFVIPRLQQPRQHPALSEARSHSHRRDMALPRNPQPPQGNLKNRGNPKDRAEGTGVPKAPTKDAPTMVRGDHPPTTLMGIMLTLPIHR